MSKDQILITGASGCVGQYIIHWLLENTNANLLLWVRDPKKIKSINCDNPRIKIIKGDLREAKKFSSSLQNVTHLIHTATAWGEPERAYKVNVVAVKNILSYLNHKSIKRIIYFSTASILNKRLEPLPEAFEHGTEYIQTKAICFKQLQKHPLSNKIVAVFPTLVFGGKVNQSDNFPTSYLTAGLNEASKWLWIARWFKGFSTFHFIHAADIAYICGILCTSNKQLDQRTTSNEIPKLVLGQPAISIDDAISSLLRWKGMKRTPSLPLSPWLVKLLIQIIPINLTKWDRFMIKQRHFTHQPVTNPENFGGRSFAKTLNEVLNVSELPQSKKRKKKVN